MTKEEFIEKQTWRISPEVTCTLEWAKEFVQECIEFGEKLERENKELEEDLEKFPVSPDYSRMPDKTYAGMMEQLKLVFDYLLEQNLKIQKLTDRVEVLENRK